MRTKMRNALGSMSGEQLLLLRIFEGARAQVGVDHELDRRARTRPLGVGLFGLSGRGVTGQRMASAA